MCIHSQGALTQTQTATLSWFCSGIINMYVTALSERDAWRTDNRERKIGGTENRHAGRAGSGI